jgi:hypothetical protein
MSVTNTDTQLKNAVERLKYKIKKELSLKIDLGVEFGFYVNEYAIFFNKKEFSVYYFVGSNVKWDLCYSLNNVCNLIVERRGIKSEYVVEYN